MALREDAQIGAAIRDARELVTDAGLALMDRRSVGELAQDEGVIDMAAAMRATQTLRDLPMTTLDRVNMQDLSEVLVRWGNTVGVRRDSPGREVEGDICAHCRGIDMVIGEDSLVDVSGLSVMTPDEANARFRDSLSSVLSHVDDSFSAESALEDGREVDF